MQHTITKLPLHILSQQPGNRMGLDALKAIMGNDWQLKATSDPPTLSAINDAIGRMVKEGHLLIDGCMIYLSDSGKISINHRSSAGRGVCVPRESLPKVPWQPYHSSRSRAHKQS